MLIQKNGSCYANVPVQLFRHSKDAGFVIIGDDAVRILVSGEEIRELYKLVRPFVEDERTPKP